MKEALKTAKDAKRKLKSLGSPESAKMAARFFKTGPGQYGEGDIFLGIQAKVMHATSREYRSLPLEELETLLRSPIHEERMLALLVLVLQVKKAEESQKKAAFDFYLQNTAHINNWDLVDASAPQVVGGHLFEKSRAPLLKLAKSASLWERRIAIIATQYFIRKKDFQDTLTISRLLLGDKEDLIHKASGWMLREVGKKDPSTLVLFLDQHAASMPRTMLRYAIEKFTQDLRQHYLGIKPTKNPAARE